MGNLRVGVVESDAALARLEGEWSQLLQETPAWSGFQSFAWVSACRAVLSRDATLFTVVFKDGPDIVAIIPTELDRGGRLRLVGGDVSNYMGPIYRPPRLAEVLETFAGFLASERRVALVDFQGLRADSPVLGALLHLSVRGWSTARATPTANCPYVDLSPGWKAIYEGHKKSQRASQRRKWESLKRLGQLEFREVNGPKETVDLLPAMFALFAQRWSDRRESSGFAGQRRPFHERAALALAAAGHLRLSVLRLDGETIAFSYAVRGEAGSSSYVLGHANLFHVNSPGMLLLLRVLEAAADRRDAEYDFSLGEERYKAAWATGSRKVFRVVFARRRPVALTRASITSMKTRVWAEAHSIRWLRTLVRDTLPRLLRGSPGERPRPDSPGLQAGSQGTWRVYRVAQTGGAQGVVVRAWTYEDMKGQLSPRLLEEAVDRNFRGDELIVVFRGEQLLGIVWQACKGRRKAVTGGQDWAPKGPVYYHPITSVDCAASDLVHCLGAESGGDFTVVSRDDQGTPHARLVATFAADYTFRVTPPPPWRRMLASFGSLGNETRPDGTSASTVAPPQSQQWEAARTEPPGTQRRTAQGPSPWKWEVLEHPDEVGAIVPAWDQLALRSPLPTFAGASFALAHLSAFVGARDRPAIHALWRSAELVAVVPLQRRGRLVRSWFPLANEQTPCWTFAVQADEPELYGRILTHLLERSEHVALRDLPAEVPHWEALHRSALAIGLPSRLRPSVNGDAYFALERPWQAFEGSISGKLRHDISGNIRKLERAGTLDFQRITGGAELPAALEQCFDVESLGWKGAAGSPIKADPATYHFYMELARRMSALGQFALYVLKLDGKVVAFKYCVRGGGRLDSLKTGFDPAWRRFSPGIVTQFLMARREVEDGEIQAIHLGHPEPHKLRWATGVAPLVMLDVYSRTVRGRIAYAGPGVLAKMPAPVVATSRRIVSGAREAGHRLRIEIGKRRSRR